MVSNYPQAASWIRTTYLEFSINQEIKIAIRRFQIFHLKISTGEK